MNESETSPAARLGTPGTVIAVSDFFMEDCFMVHNRLFIEVGQRFGKVTIIKEIEQRKNHRRHFLCKCDCGNIKEIALIRLTSGKTKSCGCLAIETTKKIFTKHGMTHHTLFNRWNSMIQRCVNPRTKAYPRYGERGITVCKEWMSFEPFMKWSFHNGFKNHLTLERKNNDGNYCPDNCEWSTVTRQANNRRTNKTLTYNGETMSIADWGRRIGISPTVIWKRLNRGWSMEKTLTQ